MEDLHKCRQVCQSWNANVMIMQMTQSKKDNIRKKAESLAYQVMTAFTSSVYHKEHTNHGTLDLSRTPDLFEIVNGAILTYHGMLGSWKTKKMYLHDVDLASVPAKHLAALAS